MFGNHKPPYTPLEKEDDLCPTEAPKAKGGCSQIFVKTILFIELFNLLLFLTVYSVIFNWRPFGQRHALDTYFALQDFNTVKTFHGDAALMNRSAESDAFFENIQRTDGVVAIDTNWALRHNFAPSVQHPEDSTKSIYQIDMFHSIHCIYRLRNLLTSRLSLEEWPRDDEHTLHCLDYIREQLMCNSDLTLEATDDLILFKINHGHTCRNSDAITDWAVSHHWAGHREYLLETTGFH